MKRTIVFAGLCGLLMGTAVASVSAFDWGGSLTQSNTIRTVSEGSDNDVLLNNTALSLYLNTGVGQYSELVAQVGARLSADPLFAADIERLELRRTQPLVGLQPVLFASRLGRFNLTDPSGYVLSTTVDGAEVDVRYRLGSVVLSMGYTGFVSKAYGSATLSRLDNFDAGDDDVFFGPKRLIGQARFNVPDVVAGHGLTVALIVQEDMRNPDETILVETSERDATSGGLLDTQYAVLRAYGPVIPNLYYDASYVLNTGRTLSFVPDSNSLTGASYQYQPIRGHLVRLQFDYFFPDARDSRAGLALNVSSGDKDYDSFVEGNTAGNAGMFTPITPMPSGAIFALEPGNATTVEVSYATKPFANLAVPLLAASQVEGALISFFRNGDGPVSAADVDTASSARYLGSELDVAWRFRPYSDLGFGVHSGLFFGNGNALFDDAQSFHFLLRIEASLSF